MQLADAHVHVDLEDPVRHILEDGPHQNFELHVRLLPDRQPRAAAVHGQPMRTVTGISGTAVTAIVPLKNTTFWRAHGRTITTVSTINVLTVALTILLILLLLHT